LGRQRAYADRDSITEALGRGGSKAKEPQAGLRISALGGKRAEERTEEQPYLLSACIHNFKPMRDVGGSGTVPPTG